MWTPVTLPPGRAKLAITPDSTRSGPPQNAITTGVEFEACLAARIAAGAMATMTSTFAVISSVAKSALGSAQLIRHVLPFDVAELTHRLAERDTGFRKGSQPSHAIHLSSLLPLGGER